VPDPAAPAGLLDRLADRRLADRLTEIDRPGQPSCFCQCGGSSGSHLRS